MHACIHSQTMHGGCGRSELEARTCPSHLRGALFVQLISCSTPRQKYVRIHTFVSKYYFKHKCLQINKFNCSLLSSYRTEDELQTMLAAYNADASHRSVITDKSSLVAILLTFAVWKAGAEIDEGFVFDVSADGTCRWCPSGLFFCDTLEDVPQLKITGHDVLRTSSKPLAERLEWFKSQCDRLRNDTKNGGEGEIDLVLSPQSWLVSCRVCMYVCVCVCVCVHKYICVCVRVTRATVFAHFGV
jgi:hypothetical protein